MEITEILSRIALYWQKFRESNSFTKEVTKELISRNIFSVKDNFHAELYFLQKIS